VGIPRLALDGIGRGHVHDRTSVPALDHRAGDALRHEELPAQVHVEDPVPSVGRDVEEGLLPGDPRVVDQHVDAAEEPLGGHHHRVDLFLLGDVEGPSRDGLAGRVELGDGRLHLALVEAAEEDAALLLQEPPSRRQADAPATARDEHPRAAQPAHPGGF
jgi:hypothetical protein